MKGKFAYFMSHVSTIEFGTYVLCKTCIILVQNWSKIGTCKDLLFSKIPQFLSGQTDILANKATFEMILLTKCHKGRRKLLIFY